MDESDGTLRFAAAGIMAVLSLIGIWVNSYVFNALTKRKSQLSIFYKLCITKTICNLVTCAAFAAWSAPCTFLNSFYLPYWANVIWGQVAGWGVYNTGICIQLCLSLNRFTVTYFPLSTATGSHKVFNIRNFLIVLVSVFLFSTMVGLPEGCSYIYSIELLSWLPEDSACALDHANKVFYFIVIIAIISNSSNLATFFKLLRATKGVNVSVFQGNRIRKRRIMFAQSLTQDCLHMIDMLACQVVYKFNDALWFQFICMSVVWLSIHVFDGFVMMLYNRDIHPACLKQRSKKPNVQISAVGSNIAKVV